MASTARHTTSAFGTPKPPTTVYTSQPPAPAIKSTFQNPEIGQHTPSSTIAPTPIENVYPVAIQQLSTSKNGTITVSPAISSATGDGGGNSLIVSPGPTATPDNGAAIAIAIGAALLLL